MMKTLLIAASTAAMIATPIAASADPWNYGYDDWRSQPTRSYDRGYDGDDDWGYDRGYDGGYDRGYDHHDSNRGALVAAGLFGLLFLSAAIASSHRHSQPYAARCDWETRAYPDYYGQVSYRQVQVCR